MFEIKVYAQSLGCPKNQVDTENILGGLGNFWSPATNPQEANLILLNTCAFIRPAVEESLETIFEIAQDIQNLNPRPLLVVTGCLVSRYGPGLGREIPEADILVSLREQKDLPLKIRNHFGLPQDKVPDLARTLTASAGTHAYLKISEGCNNRCAFCTIPSIRGRLRSRPAQELLDEAACLVDGGVSELVLVSQNSTAYGLDLGYRRGLSKLAAGLARLQGLKWLRIMYLYPAGLDTNLLESLADLGPPFVPYFDVPLQHAHPDILRLMGRAFKQDPLRVIESIRKFFPDAAIRTTLITGYPGEEEKHFSTLLNFVRQARLQHLGVFPYYAEEGTRAARFAGQLPDEVKNERRRLIMREQRKISREYLEGYLERDLEILVEEPHPEWTGLYTGRTWFQAPQVDGITYISGPDIKSGKMVTARIQNSLDYDLEALA